MQIVLALNTAAEADNITLFPQILAIIFAWTFVLLNLDCSFSKAALLLDFFKDLFPTVCLGFSVILQVQIFIGELNNSK